MWLSSDTNAERDRNAYASTNRGTYTKSTQPEPVAVTEPMPANQLAQLGTGSELANADQTRSGLLALQSH